MFRLHKSVESERVQGTFSDGVDELRNAPTEEELVSMQVNRVIRNKSEEYPEREPTVDFPYMTDHILQITSDIIIVFDNTGLILNASSRACDLLGYSLQEIKYCNLTDIFHLRQNSAAGILNFVQEGSSPFEASLITTANTYRPAVLNSYYMQYNGSKAGLIIAGLIPDQADNKDLADLQRQIRQLTDRILELEQDAREKQGFESNLMKTNFLSNISHEIRTPMNAIMGFSNLLDDPGITPDLAKEYTAVIRTSSQNLLLILDNILELSQVESTHFNLNRKSTFLPQFFKDMLNRYQEMASSMEKKIRLELSVPSAIPMDVFIDPLRVRQVFSNLLHNAIKFTDSGTIVFGYKFSGRGIEFFVRDQGIGIPDDELDSLFNRFWHGDHKLNRKYGGTGLGLTISRCLVEKMGGTIHVESVEGKGSVFSFILPAGITEYTDHPVDLKNISEIPHAECGYRFLIAEDEEVNYFLLREMLGQLGISPVWARNGEDVVNLVRGEAFDLVLMDMKMPGVNGFEATRMIREFNTQLPIVALTAYAMENDRKRCLDAGCNNYMAKPVMREDLFSMIRQYCKGELKGN